MDCCCTHKTKHRTEAEVTALIHRLNRIEGQIRGIRGMVEKDAYCTDIITQVAAAGAAGQPHPLLRGGGYPRRQR